MKELSRITHEMLATLNSLSKEKERLVEITVDGGITVDEMPDFLRIKEQLERMLLAIDALQLWVDMEKKYPHLCSPITIGNVTFKNRIFSSPMGGTDIENDGWLINQFLSPYFNKRDDEYGGTLDNRCRFAIEVLKCVRENVAPGFPIEFRLSGSELFDGDYDLAGGVEISKKIEPYIDLLHVTAGTYQVGFADTHPSMFKAHGCNVYLAEEIKKHVSVPVATIGALGMKPRRELVDSPRSAAPYVAVIGDANKVDSVKTAVYQGYHAALDI